MTSVGEVNQDDSIIDDRKKIRGTYRFFRKKRSDLCDTIGRYYFFNDFKYSCSTFSRAHGVFRRNVREDLIDGLLLKQLILIFEASSSQVYTWVKCSRISINFTP